MNKKGLTDRVETRNGYVLLKPEEMSDKSEGGVLLALPKRPKNMGIVIDTGGWKFLKKGDKIIFAPLGGHVFDGKMFLEREKILAKITK